jgi:hypothetical protein
MIYLTSTWNGNPMWKKAKDIVPGDTVFDRGQTFIVKEVHLRQGGIAFLDTEGVWHGVYHLEEYLGIGE